MADILWLSGGNFSNKQQVSQTKACENVGIPVRRIRYYSPAGQVGALSRIKGSKQVACFEKQEDFDKLMHSLIELVNPTVIVTTDFGCMSLLTGDDDKSVDTRRGSVYLYKGIPVIVTIPSYMIHRQRENGFIINMDLMKIKRWIDQEQEKEPEFAFTVCETAPDLARLWHDAEQAVVISEDLETSHGMISLVNLSMLLRDGQLKTWLIPFINPTKEGNCHWDEYEDELAAWHMLREINQLDCPKVFHNGIYDVAYLIRYRVPPKNYILDTQLLTHSIWAESKKSLAFVSSIMVDVYRYWKDEIKGDKKDKGSKERIPSTPEGYAIWLRYGAQDSYYTLLSCFKLVRLILAHDWALGNYNERIRLVNGPGIAGSLRGFKVDPARHAYKVKQWHKQADKALADLRTSVDDPTFNPRSNDEFASLLYDVLGAQGVKRRGVKTKKSSERSVDEKMLKRVRLQHPLLAKVIDMVWDYKKPENRISKFGEMWKLGLNGRFHYTLRVDGTKTSRFSSGNSQFWVGTNAQNIEKGNRDMFVADDGYILFEADYSQSDSYYVAYTANDDDMIKNLLAPEDTHCLHAAFFFKKDYKEIFDGYKAKEPWVVDSLNGVRQNTKRVTHGANYDMEGETLFYQSMGREAVVGAGKALGYEDCHKWSDKQLIMRVCTPLLQAYFDMYPRLNIAKQELIAQAIASRNIVRSAHGFTRLIFGNMRSDKAVQRDLFSFIGQGGTSGAINRTLSKLWYERQIEKRYRCFFLTQTHDSVTYAIHHSCLHECAREILDVMELPFTIGEHQVVVPADAEVGLDWGYNMQGYHDKITYEDLLASNAKWEEKHYAKAA